MKEKHKNFILNRLIPFILRERGNGFIMNDWVDPYPKEAGKRQYDGVIHRPPVCATAACIGGSVQLLKKLSQMSYQKGAEILGISEQQAYGLFYDWEVVKRRDCCSWPQKFAVRFAKAKTPLGKAKAAVALLKEVVRTKGACLDPDEEFRDQ